AAAQRLGLELRLDRRHEERRGKALAGDVRHREEEAARIEPEAIVEIAAHRARRLEERGDANAPVLAGRLARVGQEPHLDTACGIHLAREARRLLAQHAPLAL